jgi:hypothetical protein
MCDAGNRYARYVGYGTIGPQLSDGDRLARRGTHAIKPEIDALSGHVVFANQHDFDVRPDSALPMGHFGAANRGQSSLADSPDL